jgi:hypothetical protein
LEFGLPAVGRGNRLKAELQTVEVQTAFFKRGTKLKTALETQRC